MTASRLTCCICALGFVLVGAAAAGEVAPSQKAVLEMGNTLSGTIERVDNKGRITVNGETVAVTKDTQIMTPLKARVAPIELRVGTEVEISVVEGAAGDEAAVIIANVVR